MKKALQASTLKKCFNSTASVCFHKDLSFSGNVIRRNAENKERQRNELPQFVRTAQKEPYGSFFYSTIGFFFYCPFLSDLCNATELFLFFIGESFPAEQE